MHTVTLPIGQLRGKSAGEHLEFLGVPYAAPPTGSRRFCPPAPVIPWEGIRDATQYGAACPQGQHPIPGMAASGPRSEDCLFLNIFTPACDDKKRPVMYWIHGGGFRLGAGSEALYHGGPLAERGDVVVISINYRLAALGYACFGEASRVWGASANCGQLDMIEGLRWVKQYISAFGGDPDNVTLFGESAGSAAVSTLLAMPSAKGLFHKAIMQSGAGSAAPFEAASEFGIGLLNALGVSADNQAALQALEVDDIVAKAIELGGEMGSIGLGPAIDGITLLLSPASANKAGESADIPLLVGTNRDEMKLFNETPNRPALTDDELLTRVNRLLSVNKDVAQSVIDTFRASRLAQGKSASTNDVFDLIQSVVQFRNPSFDFATQHARWQPDTYYYLFTHESPARRGALGACHALEMPFVFGTLDAPTQDKFAGTGPECEKLSHDMMDAWLCFARTGKPSHPGIGNWPAFSEAAPHTMMLDKPCHLALDPFSTERLAIRQEP